MAFSSAKVKRLNLGNGYIEIHSFDADSVTSGTISTGLGQIDHVSLNNAVTEGDGQATISGSSVSLSGLTSDDTGTVMVIGH